jgi:hypothetical protein
MMSSTVWVCLVLSPATPHLVSGTTSAAWSHPVLLLYYTKHGSYRGAVPSGHITSVAMFRSGQMG